MNLDKHIYFNQLNGLRFIAVFIVLMDHWLIPYIPLPIGHLGVVIFFVLSGFLISRILYISSDKANQGGISKWIHLKNFIIRRSLRIFPIYYLILLFGLIFNISEVRENWKWLFSYLPNIYIIVHEKWLGVWDHLWSLAVEEQYYLFFPYFILFLPQRKYKYLLYCMLIIGFLSRFFIFLFSSDKFLESSYMVSYVNPISAIDCFGLGGLLAYFYHYEKEQFLRIIKLRFTIRISFLMYLISLLYSHNSELQHANIGFSVLERFFAAIFSFFLIAECVSEKTNFLTNFLIYKPINYLGKISYGLYLYHNFIYNYYHFEKNTLWWLLTRKLSTHYLELINFVPLKFILNFTILVVIASLSWFFIEKPINDLKNKFE
ncbi:MAG: acyltransferase family protein [Aquirufa sp.]